jgi:site-specific DNA-methyltransferase (adenine-specific)
LNSADFADCELAWTSFDSAVRKFTYRWNGMLQQDMSNKEIRIHPTQKPVALYDWIFKNYAKEGDKILDTHLGSGSSRIAAHRAGLDFTGFEIDSEYFAASAKRYLEFTAQLTMFQV